MVMHLLTEELSVQLAGTAIFMLPRVDHVQCHVTPPHYSRLAQQSKACLYPNRS